MASGTVWYKDPVENGPTIKSYGYEFKSCIVDLTFKDLFVLFDTETNKMEFCIPLENVGYVKFDIK